LVTPGRGLKKLLPIITCMTKAQIAEQVFIAVNGGEISPDSSVERVDILSLCPAAISGAINELENQEIINNLREFRLSGVAPGISKIIPITETYTPQKNDARGVYEIKLKGKPYLQPRYQVQVSPLQGREYIFLHSRSNLPTETYGMRFSWVEKVEGDFYLYIDGILPPVGEHIVKVSYDISVMDNDEELGLPDGVEIRAIQILTDFFNYQRGSAKDFKLDYRDDTKQEGTV